MNQVIIVDDDKAVGDVIARNIVAKNLATESDIRVFPSSSEAWKHISQLTEKPRIVFSSVDIDASAQGQMNGFDLLTATKEKFPDVIFVSMSGDPGYDEEARRRGADHFLAKPFSPEDLERIFAENIPKK